jgi:uncharacterized iron-regulated membrane protein
MRKWHRWLSILFGVFLLWISITGVLSQIVPIVQRGGFEDENRERAGQLASAAPTGFVCPETMMCRPKPPQGRGNIVGLLHHLHSGESFGPLGTIIGTLSGFAMVFFSFSGLWMYINMFRRRNKAEKTGLFWN